MTQRIVLGVDPGLAKMGWGVIDGRGASFRLVAYGAVRTASDEPHAERLRRIYDELARVIEEHRPGVMAIEEVFQGRNAKSALRAGEGRGACILAGAHAGLAVIEIAASVAKLGVTGSGRASKQQVQAMVRRLLGLAEPPRPADAADALAVALTYAQRRRSPLLGSARIVRSVALPERLR
jgi:crossover junction endodeoxyribonuclease RuvC